MALAFIIFFGLVTTAVLQFADAVEFEQSHAHSTTASDASAEGGMLFAAQAAEEQGGCIVGSHATIAMTTGTSASYTTTACNPGETGDVIADQCAVCVLGQQGVAPSLNVQGTLWADGPIAVSGDASNNGTVTSAISISTGSTGFIGCSSACELGTNGHYTPSATRTLTGGPSPSAAAPSVPASGCSSYTGTSGGYIPAGCYSSIDVDCSHSFFFFPCQYRLGPGSFVIDGPFTIGTGTGPLTTVVTTGRVLLAFIQGAPGGSLLINADGSLSLPDGPLSGNQDVELYVDPTDTAGSISIDGGSLSVQGTVYAPGTGVGIQKGSVTTAPNRTDAGSGRLIAGSLTVGPRAQVTVTAMPPSPGYCWVYDDTVTVTSGAGNATGQVDVESDCSGATTSTGIIAISYG